MLKKSFFNRQTTAVTALFAGASIEELLAKARTAEGDGADAVAVELWKLPPELRTADNFRCLMREVRLPFMFICYRNDLWFKDDDTNRQECLLLAAEAGAEVIDVMGDLFDPTPGELTRNPAAIKKQKELIAEIHNLGAKVIMSSHLTSGPALDRNQVLEMLEEQASRGVDAVKIVTSVNTEDELLEAIGTTMLLNRKMKLPFVHLCSGSFSKIHRYLGTKLGVAITFGVPGYESSSGYNQPTVKSFKKVMDNLHWDLNNAIQ